LGTFLGQPETTLSTPQAPHNVQEQRKISFKTPKKIEKGVKTGLKVVRTLQSSLEQAKTS
jgi:hypothetical protein